MALIIEDGTGKADAESYATAADFADYGTLYGVTVPDTEAEQEALLRQAAVQMANCSQTTTSPRVLSMARWPWLLRYSTTRQTRQTSAKGRSQKRR